jgi:hypothetical protein
VKEEDNRLLDRKKREWIRLAQVRELDRALVKTVMNLQVA